MSFLDVLRRDRVVVILRSSSTWRFRDVIDVCVRQGLRTVEFSLTTPGALDAIAAVRADPPPGVVIGAGTVTTPQLARDAASAGAEFLVTPAACLDVVTVAAELDIPVIAGAFTPTEVLTAHQTGAAAVKVFPASLGGPEYIRSLRDPFPQIPLVPTGGVGAAAATAYMSAGAVALGVGSPIYGDVFTGGDLATLSARAAQFARMVGGAEVDDD